MGSGSPSEKHTSSGTLKSRQHNGFDLVKSIPLDPWGGLRFCGAPLCTASVARLVCLGIHEGPRTPTRDQHSIIPPPCLLTLSARPDPPRVVAHRLGPEACTIVPSRRANPCTDNPRQTFEKHRLWRRLLAERAASRSDDIVFVQVHSSNLHARRIGIALPAGCPVRLHILGPRRRTTARRGCG